MTDAATIRRETDRAMQAFQAAGADLFETGMLQPADTLLDLYGEDIRARAFVTLDPLRREMMLRPDFTVPVVQAHLASARGAAKYRYAGPVFRQQPDGSDRALEYAQVGFEDFGAGDPAKADAALFALFHGLLNPLGLTAATGDIGLLRAAVGALETSDLRKAALMRHLWRPRRFRDLIDRYSKPVPVPNAASDVDAPEIGLRSRAEVQDRLDRLEADAKTPPIPQEQADLIAALLAVKDTSDLALAQLRDLARNLPAIRDAVAGLAARLDAMADHGVAAEALGFEASYGRTSMEYYDGFVFGFYAANRPDLPPVASGGRYDALTRALGGDTAPPATGGVIRPGLIAELGLAQ
ncbi:MAG: ATP phosphoribosyltransferase regulatory subunit [Pseudomonadota bacterium]